MRRINASNWWQFRDSHSTQSVHPTNYDIGCMHWHAACCHAPALKTEFIDAETSFKILLQSTRTEFGKCQSPSATEWLLIKSDKCACGEQCRACVVLNHKEAIFLFVPRAAETKCPIFRKHALHGRIWHAIKFDASQGITYMAIEFRINSLLALPTIEFRISYIFGGIPVVHICTS